MSRMLVPLLLLVTLAGAGEADRLREEIASLRFLAGLGLSREQAAALLPIAAEGAALRRDFDRERDRLCVRLHDALLRLREEDRKDEGLSDAAIAAAGGADHEGKLLGNRAAAAFAPLEERAGALLGPGQRRFAFPEAEERHPIDLLRELKGSDFDEWRDRLARLLANARVSAGLVARGDDRAERLRIAGILHAAGRMDAGEYALGREALLRDLVPDRERSRIEAEIRRILRARYGRAGPLAEWLFRESMLPVIAARARLPAPELPPLPPSGLTLPGRLETIRAEVERLRAEINLWNLMNGLHLAVPQLRELVRAARGVADAQAPLAEEERGERDLDALREVRDALLRGEEPPPGALAALQSPLAKRGSGYLAARARELAEAREAGVERMLRTLRAEHGPVLRNYSACLIPPQDLRDPVRAGQAADSAPLESLVDRLRALRLGPEAQGEAERLLAAIEEHDGRIPAEERDCELMRMLGVACEAQALDDAGYAARRSELAARLAPVRRLSALKERLMEVEGDATVIRGKIAAFLLDPRIIPLAEDRIARLGDPERRARPEIPKAEICEEGKCGKP